MTIWIITTGEPLPVDGKTTRLFRSSILSDYLIKKGHKVIRWTTTVNHVTKKFRYNEDTDVQVNENYLIKLLHSIGYQKNISIKRLIDHYFLATKFQKIISKYSKNDFPDLILCSFPTIQLARVATDFGKKNNIPVVIDARDMWPDIFLHNLPQILQPLAKFFCHPLFTATTKAFSNATAITGMTHSFVEWGLSYAKRKATSLDIAFPFGYVENAYSNNEKELADNYWHQLGITKNSGKMYISLVAYLGNVIDFDIIVDTAQILIIQNPNIEFIIAGKGEKEEEFKEKAKNLYNIKFVGWIDGAKIGSLLRLSRVGILPYKDRLDFRMSIPNKIPEYLSVGLPVITTLQGVATDMLRDNKCGFYARNPIEFANALVQIYDNKDLQKNLSIKALQTYQGYFNAEKVYNDFVNYIENIVLKSKTENE